MWYDCELRRTMKFYSKYGSLIFKTDQQADASALITVKVGSKSVHRITNLAAILRFSHPDFRLILTDKKEF